MSGSTPGSEPSGPSSSVSTTDEERLPGVLPRWEVPGWRDRFGVRAGITGRGDDPAKPFDLGLWATSPASEVMSRWRQFRAAFPEFTGSVMAHQAHGQRVLWHRGGPGWTIHDGADGHATSATGLLLLITVADCVPIYLVAPARGVVALLHAGWRGTAAGILREGLETLHRMAGVEPAELTMHLGVAISGPCYQVGSEVVRGVGQIPVGKGPWYVDLRDALAEQGTKLGIGEISRSRRCTASSPGDFFSHRASGGAAGRMVAYLGMPGDTPAAR